MADDAKFGMGANMKSKPKKFVRAYYKTKVDIAAKALINGKNATMTYSNSTVDLKTGDGKLTFASDSHSYNTGVIAGRGDVILDHVDIYMDLPETKGKSNGIYTTGGDIIIKGGKWTVNSYDDPNTYHAIGQSSGYRNNQEAIHSAVFAKKRAGI